MEIKQLKHMLAVAEQGNYARAALVLGITQSALSQSIARLETSVSTRLFERGRFGAVLTEAGEQLRLRAHSIVAEERLATLELAATGGAAHGTLTIGVGKDAATALAPRVVARFLARRPEVTVTVHEGWSPDLHRRLLLGELDFVVSGPSAALTLHPELEQERLYLQREHITFALSHPLGPVTHPTLAELASHRWVVPPHGSGRVRTLRRQFEELGHSPPDRFVRTDSIAFLNALLISGAAVAITSLDLVPLEYRATVRVIEMFEFQQERCMSITTRARSRPQPLAAALMEEFRAAVRRADARDKQAKQRLVGRH